jgi:autotransporter-associated beta strand protein
MTGGTTINVSNATATFNISGALNGSGNDLTKIGTGRLVLSGADTYNNTIINGGQLRIGDGGTTGNLGSGNVTLGGALEFNRSDTYTVDNFITNIGTISQVGTGTTILNNTNSDFQG